MHVYVVIANNELMSVCGDKQSAELDRNLCEMEGHKNVEIKECSVITYDKDSYDRQMDATIHNRFPLIKEFAKAIHNGSK